MRMGLSDAVREGSVGKAENPLSGERPTLYRDVPPVKADRQARCPDTPTEAVSDPEADAMQ